MYLKEIPCINKVTITITRVHRVPGGGVLPYKSDRGARRTFQGFKFADWYRLGC